MPSQIVKLSSSIPIDNALAKIVVFIMTVAPLWMLLQRNCWDSEPGGAGDIMEYDFKDRRRSIVDLVMYGLIVTVKVFSSLVYAQFWLVAWAMATGREVFFLFEIPEKCTAWLLRGDLPESPKRQEI